jgi:hypothetical protein
MGTMLSLILVGCSTNYWMALSGRIIGGLLNGNIGCIQTMVGELVKKPEHEREYLQYHSSEAAPLTLCSSSLCCYAICVVDWNNHWAGTYC